MAGEPDLSKFTGSGGRGPASVRRWSSKSKVKDTSEERCLQAVLVARTKDFAGTTASETVTSTDQRQKNISKYSHPGLYCVLQKSYLRND